jgi:hypothetical protein
MLVALNSIKVFVTKIELMTNMILVMFGEIELMTDMTMPYCWTLGLLQ